MSYDLHKVLLCGDFEGDPSKQEFVGEDSHTPNIDFVVVGFPFEKFSRDIERSAAEGPPHSVGADGPAEIAQFEQPLHILSKVHSDR